MPVLRVSASDWTKCWAFVVCVHCVY